MSAPTACRPALTLAISAAVLFAAACSGDTARLRPTEPLLGKTSGSPTVTSTSPSYGYQGTVNLNVTINGSGFDNGSSASWSLNGVPTAKITVNSTSFVSSSQLVANISIASDAQIDSYDVVVTTSTTKQGIGSDCFMVTLAVANPVVGHAINMAGQIVGDAVNAKTATGALWDPQRGLITLPNASTAVGIDEVGATIGGQDKNSAPAVWTSPAGAAGPWTETVLTLPTGLRVGSARGMASDVNGNTVFIAGSYRLTTNPPRPVVWTHTANGWQAEFDTLPTGVPAGWAQSINAKGQRVGMDGSAGYYALYWDSLGTATLLSSHAATAWSINGDGTVVVGSANGVAAMWTRTLTYDVNGNPVYSAWSGDIFLDTPANSCSSPGSTGFAVNAAGTVVVGKSCNQPVAWNIAGGTITRFLLGTLGPPAYGTAYAINNLAMPNAAGGGGQTGSGFSTGILWKSFE